MGCHGNVANLVHGACKSLKILHFPFSIFKISFFQSPFFHFSFFSFFFSFSNIPFFFAIVFVLLFIFLFLLLKSSTCEVDYFSFVKIQFLGSVDRG